MYLLKFLRKFITILGKILGAKILANPLSFLGVTSVFGLAIFMDKKAISSKDVDNDKLRGKVEVKQNNISLFNFVKNIKK